MELQDNSYLRMGSATVPNTPIFATKSQNGDKKSYIQSQMSFTPDHPPQTIDFH